MTKKKPNALRPGQYDRSVFQLVQRWQMSLRIAQAYHRGVYSFEHLLTIAKTLEDINLNYGTYDTKSNNNPPQR